ncbi:DNA-protecting protein DprA [Thalassotalea sp. HSM 43]|uniref:DNA-processing protein DprA n=1 Tax=Thalassotalea sp. HSM 43 TaxID=2552945 RepID=UPI0010815157|nr:DNA-processing protein DprA [Thalassotalea sp. HSM 43]QBY04435.1 DNA-protecting protein DprA [Thalassotalea sp. HSM 43]
MMTSAHTTLVSYLRLRLVPRLANNIKIKLLHQYGLDGLRKLDASALSSMGFSHKQRQAMLNPEIKRIEQFIELANKHQMSIIGYLDKRYPQQLKHIENAPIVLFVQGNIKLLNLPQLAMVGSRSATVGARHHCHQFAADLSRYCVITSGLAIGIDAAAHCGALDANGYTLAVVATGLDSVYPARHRALAKRILDQQGTIISECLPGSKPFAGAFPRRNRIVTGMSLGVFVIEATLKSGSLISARLALEQNREVFAMPGAISNVQTQGCHYLLKQGAQLVDNHADIVDMLDLKPLAGRINIEQQLLAKTGLKKLQKKCSEDLFLDPLLRSVDYEAVTTVDIIASRSKLPIEEVLTRLMTLELRGLVTAVPGGYIKLQHKV